MVENHSKEKLESIFNAQFFISAAFQIRVGFMNRHGPESGKYFASKYPIGTKSKSLRNIKALKFHSALVLRSKVVFKVASGRR